VFAGLLLLLGLGLSTAEAQTVSDVRPSSGAPGTTIRLTGSGFDTDGTDTVLIGGAEASITGVSGGGTALTVTVPSGPVGPVDVSVNGTTLPSPFTVVTGGPGFFSQLSQSVVDVEDGVVDWVDVDGDGDLDLFVSGRNSDGDLIAAVYENENGSFSLLNPDGDGNTTGLSGVTQGASDWGDYDGDGDPDLILTGTQSETPTTTLYENDVGGTGFSAVGAGLQGVEDGSADWGDVDGDGDLDLLITGNTGSGPSATIYRNDGEGSFSVFNDGDEDENTDGLRPVSNSAAAWADVDGNGTLDLVIIGSDAGIEVAGIYVNNEGAFSLLNDDDSDGNTDGLTAVENGAVAWGDFDGDGDPDLALTGEEGGFAATPTTAVYENDLANENGFSSLSAGLTDVTDGSVQWADVDGDGDPDLSVAGIDGGTPIAVVYENDGGTFSALNPGPAGNSAQLAGLEQPSVSWGDVNGDGDLDLAAVGALPVGAESTEPATVLYENTSPPPSVLYVSPSGNDDNDGSSWGSAYRTLKKALQRAAPSFTTEIWIAEGRYTPDQGPGVTDGDPSASFELVEDVDLYGGFDGTESSRAERDAAAHPTILSGDIDDNDADPNDDDIIADASDIQGDNSYNVVTGRNLSSQVRLDGLVLTGGDASGGSFPESIGGALRLDNVDVLGTNLRLVGNRAASSAGGGALSGNSTSSITLGNSIVAGNRAETGSVFAGPASVRLVNSVLLDNRGNGAVIDAESDVDLHTVTATQNEGVVAEVINSTIRVENSILWGNNGGNAQLRPDDSDSSVDLVNVLIQGGASDGVTGGGFVDTQTNVLDADPLFVTPPGTGITPGGLGDALSLRASSPAFDAGDPELLPTDLPDLDRDGNTSEPLSRDLQGNRRVLNRGLDLGAFERTPPSFLVSPDAVELGETPTLTVTVESGFNPTNSEQHSAQLYARPGGAGNMSYTGPISPSSSETISADSAEISFSLSDTATLRGIDYYAVLSNGNSTLTLPPGGFPDTAKVRPAHLPTSVTDVTANAPFKEEAYQMVSVPAQPASGILGTLRESYGEYDPADWRVLRWDPTRSTYREPPELDTLSPGMGAWLITERGTPFRVSGTTVDAASPRKIPLPAGWSQVGTPFGFAVPWDSVRTTSGRSVDAPIGYDADRGFRYNRSTLTPWQGYFVYNPSDADTLVVPPIGTDGSNATTTSPGVLAGSGLSGTTSAKSSDAPSVVRVDARTGDGRPQSVWLGLHADAKTGRDALDFAQAPPVDADVQLSILETIGGTAVPHAGSFKPMQGDGQTWSLQLRRSKTASSAQTVSLFPQTSGSLPAGYNLYLLDAEEERRITPGESVSLAPGERSSLTLILGTEAYAKRSGAAGLDAYENELRGNAPNPFSDQTTISYVLASDQTVTLTIFNVLGQRVRTLVQDRRSKGLHHVTWNGTTRYGDRAGSGVYFYRLQGEDFTETRKMVLVR
jgi:hypothetical protein